ncbi:hypothetical protein DSO57_1003717 [Entomophthora muscae]|uniref:Uncharacterized protein n=1 Tax=Entomophthora muscae TaxID=34485 RepID=A0ACC2SXW4_9FUNG|nr:hypothetical protein DSO57_1003717 [Entomophthora muscae]
MKFFVYLMAYGGATLNGYNLQKCQLGGNRLSAAKEYMNLVNIPLPKVCRKGSCHLDSSITENCAQISIYASHAPMNANVNKTALTMLLAGQSGKAAYAGINFDLRSWGDFPKHLGNLDPSLAKRSTLALSFKHLSKVNDLQKVVKSFHAIFIHEVDISSDYFNRNAYDVMYDFRYSMAVEKFIHAANVYTVLTPAQYRIVAKCLPDINTVTEDEIYLRTHHWHGDSSPRKAQWYQILHTQKSSYTCPFRMGCNF